MTFLDNHAARKLFVKLFKRRPYINTHFNPVADVDQKVLKLFSLGYSWARKLKP